MRGLVVIDGGVVTGMIDCDGVIVAGVRWRYYDVVGGVVVGGVMGS